MMRKLMIALALVFLGSALSATEPERFQVGQVWEYKTRPQDVGSLVKIQAIEAEAIGRVYHVSMTGISMKPPMVGEAAHLPVSRETLEHSITRLAPTDSTFPDLDFNAGIAEWRRAKGGVFTIPLDQIAGFLDEMSRR